MKRLKNLVWLLLILPAGCRNAVVKTPVEEIPRVRVMKVTLEQARIPVHSSGIVMPLEEIRLAFKTGGIVEKINVREGDRVDRGQVLAALNPSEISANVELARNGYEKALRDWTRIRNLYSDTVATLEQMQNATTALNVAKSNLNIAIFNQSHSTILAPESGIILRQLVRTNEMVSSGYPVFLFGTSGKTWKIKSGLPDRDVLKINPGDSASIIIDAYPEIIFSGIVDQISSMSDPLTGTYETEINLDGKGYRLAAGLVARVDIYPAGKESFNLLPAGAIVDADGHKGFIWALTDSGTVQKTAIEIERISGQEIAVKGIPEGITQIVSEGAAYLKDGQKVKIVN